MAKIVTVHSYNKGTGKSRVATNLAALLVAEGQRVGLIEANLEAPSLASIFRLRETDAQFVDDYLLGRCQIGDTVRELTPPEINQMGGQLFVAPASTDPGSLAQLVNHGYPSDLLQKAVLQLDRELALNTVIVETGAGLQEPTLALVALSHVTLVMMLIDKRQYNGTATTIEIARQLGVPSVVLVINDVPPIYREEQVRQEAENTYKCPVAVLAHSDVLAAMAGQGIFVIAHPGDPLTSAFKRVKTLLTE